MDGCLYLNLRYCCPEFIANGKQFPDLKLTNQLTRLRSKEVLLRNADQ